MKNKLKTYLISIGIALGVGGLSAEWARTEELS